MSYLPTPSFEAADPLGIRNAARPVAERYVVHAAHQSSSQSSDQSIDQSNVLRMIALISCFRFILE